jgi:hypothetical protein
MSESFVCFKCLKNLNDLGSKISFREACPYCGADVHTCKNCKYFYLGKPNDCLVPGTERVADREAFNFCEDFQRKCSTATPQFKKDFNSLFKDES